MFAILVFLFLYRDTEHLISYSWKVLVFEFVDSENPSCHFPRVVVKMIRGNWKYVAERWPIFKTPVLRRCRQYWGRHSFLSSSSSFFAPPPIHFFHISLKYIAMNQIRNSEQVLEKKFSKLFLPHKE